MLGESRIHRKKPITKWNILALIALLVLGGSTLALDQHWMSTWLNSGKAFPIGQPARIELPAGLSHIYYESPVSVPVADCKLYMTDEAGERISPASPPHDISYSMLFQGWSGRAMWRLELVQAGAFEFTCFNNNTLSRDGIPAADRVVFLKQPDTLDEVKVVQSVVRITGGSITFVLVMVFYLLHAAELRKRDTIARTGAKSQEVASFRTIV